MKPQRTSAVLAFDAETRLSNSAKLTGHGSCGGLPPWVCHTGFSKRSASLCAQYLSRKAAVVDLLWDDIEIKALGSSRLLIHEQRQTLGCGISQPILDRDAVALRLRNLLALVVEEKLVGVGLRRRDTEPLPDFHRHLDRGNQILAR